MHEIKCLLKFAVQKCCYFDLLILQHCLYAGKQRSFFFFTLLLTCTQKHSQLDLSLFEFLQRPLSFTGRESWGELSSLNSTKELHQQVKSEEENTVKPRWTAEKKRAGNWFMGVVFSDLCAVSLELVKQRTGLSFMRRMKWRMRRGFLLNVQGT